MKIEEIEKNLKERILDISRLTDDAAIKEEKKKVLKAALKDTFALCTEGMMAREQDVKQLAMAVAGEFYSIESQHAMRQALFPSFDGDKYEALAKTLMEKAMRVYAKYFSRFTVIQNGRVYNAINGMYWEPEAGAWHRSVDGLEEYSYLLPYEGQAPQAACA